MKNLIGLALAALVLLVACSPAASPVNATTQPTDLPVPTSTPVLPTSEPVPASPWWNDAVFYEVFVRSFKDSDGDGKGDINGLIEQLDYLNDGDPNTTNDLGITGIWLMPITESPSYHGYDVVDYFAVDQEYGTKEDFKRLMAEAHKRGIRIIVDLVLNHTSSGHPWFKAARKNDPQYHDWYIWSDQFLTYKGPWGQQVWYAAGGAYYYAVFGSGMPDLNLQNPQVTAEIHDIVRFWLEDMQVDGFRLDAIKHLIEKGQVQENTRDTHIWLQGFHQYYKELEPQAFTVGEAWTSTSQILDYTGDEVDIAFEFDLAKSFVSAAKGPVAASAISQMGLVLDKYPQNQYAVFLTNHDQDRVMSVLKDDQHSKLAATMLLTAPGVPFVYYGEEIGMTGTKPDEDIRRPMQWTSENAKVGFTTGSPWRIPASDFKTRSVALQDNDPNSLLSHYRALIALRNTHPALRTGDTLVVESGTPRLYALLRYQGPEAFLILVNVHPQPLAAEQYSLKLENGPFTGPLQAQVVLGTGMVSAPQLNTSGGFDDYHPLSEIPAESSVIIRLAP